MAGPLIGSVIFLAGILFILNLNQAEAADVSKVVTEAYHNRITSVLEIYRADLAAVFRTSMSRNIEFFLTSRCWVNLGDLSNGNNPNQGQQCLYNDYDGSIKPCDLDGNGIVDYSELRYAKCVEFNSIIQDTVCSQVPDYGLPALMNTVLDPVSFEGITLSPANKVQAQALSDFNRATYPKACRTLLKGSLFDCSNFAHNFNKPFRCIDRNGIEIKGCEGGTFYAGLNVEDSEVFTALPRTQARDNLGNEIRTGSISDQNLYLPIRYPLYWYLDRTLKDYAYLAYGSNTLDGSNNEVPVQSPDYVFGHACNNAASGIANGVCLGGSDCNYNNIVVQDQPYKARCAYGASSDKPTSLKTVITDFTNNVFDVMCSKSTSIEFGNGAMLSDRNIDDNNGISLQLCPSANTCPMPEDPSLAGRWHNCLDKPTILSDMLTEQNPLAATSVACTADKKSFCGIINNVISLQLRLQDDRKETRVDPNYPNYFCIEINPVLESPPAAH